MHRWVQVDRSNRPAGSPTGAATCLYLQFVYDSGRACHGRWLSVCLSGLSAFHNVCGVARLAVNIANPAVGVPENIPRGAGCAFRIMLATCALVWPFKESTSTCLIGQLIWLSGCVGLTELPLNTQGTALASCLSYHMPLPGLLPKSADPDPAGG